MAKKKMITLDLTGCKGLGELHQRIKKAFDFPDFYGENWEAFDDLLWSECDADGVLIIGEATLSKEFDSQMEVMHQILQRNRESLARQQHDFEIKIVG